MSAPPELVAFHIGVVVGDLDAAIDRYRRMFGLDRWHKNLGPDAARAYGGREGGGFAFELIQPTAAGYYADYLGQRGEGVEHVGFWTPDLLGSLRAAVAEGGTLIARGFEARGNAVVQLEMPAGAHPFATALAFIDPGAGALRFELIGPAAEKPLRDWLGEDFDRIMPGPPRAKAARPSA